MKPIEVRIIRYPDFDVAIFETYMFADQAEDPDNGRKVRHYVFKNGEGYTHIQRWLTSALDPIEAPGVSVSERVFFGRARLAQLETRLRTTTWRAVMDSVETLERLLRERQ